MICLIELRRVAVIGAGMASVTSGSGRTLSELFVDAASKAINDAGVGNINSIYVGNMMSGFLQNQEHLGALMATALRREGIPAFKIEGACASGGVAMNAAVKAVLSGLEDIVLVGGVERMSGYSTAEVTEGLMMAEDRIKVASTGVTFVGLNAMIAREYMRKYNVTHEMIAEFPVLCHANALDNPFAQFHKKISVQDVLASTLVADPLRLYDCAGIGDGAAALILVPMERVHEFTESSVEVLASSVATDSLSLYQREDITTFEASKSAARRAYEIAHINPEEVDVLEIHDAFSVLGPMALEDLGFAEKGSGARMVADGQCARDGKLPTNTYGGLKARGHPVGASGVYQLAELVLQLSNRSGKCQVPDANIGLSQNVGGIGSTIVVHVLKRSD
jgi:acetyl-CoA C-acetyltransferase